MAPTRWEEMRRQFKWVARDVMLNFICPKCGLEIPEGNPGVCPHKDYDSPPVKFDPKIDTPAEGLITILRRMGYSALADDMSGKRRR